MTVAAFMDLVLYDSTFGYYARSVQRSGRTGDFFTSVDVGPLFGELLELQLAQMAGIVSEVNDVRNATGEPSTPAPFDLVEAGAGNGRLAGDILRAARRRQARYCEQVRLHLVEVSAEARRAQPDVLGDVVDRLCSSSPTLPASFEGVLFANELLDAMPVHQVVMRDDGLREVYVDVAPPVDGRLPARLITREGPLSTTALSDYLSRVGAELHPGWRAEINLRAPAWIADAARRLRRGFMILIDYGHEARELYSATHAGGTLTTFSGHSMSGAEASPDEPAWLKRPGAQDLTSHVDFTSVRAAAEAAGMTTIGFLDQTYFVLGLLTSAAPQSRDSLTSPESQPHDDLHRRLALKTLLMPGGLGSTHKVLILGKDVGSPDLAGCSYRLRVT
jgi:SAM-dependent MidA family methyltransferase